MEDNESNMLEHLRWILDKQIGWISSAETKATTFIAFNSATLTVLGTLFELKSITKQFILLHEYYFIAAALTTLCGVRALYFLLKVFSPILKGGSRATHSFIFFKLITERLEEFYKKEASKQSYACLVEDISLQIFANARIAQIKHTFLQNGIKYTLITMLLAVVTICLKIFK